MADETHRLIYADTAHYMLLEGYDIRDVPTAADVQPVKRGRWICNEELYYNGMTKCSCCNSEYYVEDLQTLQGDADMVYFCPNCGADMRGDTE